MGTSLVIVGSGPGGYAAAFRAADLGFEVTLVDADPQPGGVCLHRGCIPSKALLHAAAVINESRAAREYGLTFGEPELDVDKLRHWKDDVVQQLARGVASLAKARKVQFVQARARFLSSRKLELDAADGSKRELQADHVVLATGSRPLWPRDLQIDDQRVMDSTGALALQQVPEHLLVIGGGYIGLEIATVYAALGSSVRIVELLDGLLTGVDPELVRPLQRRLATQVAGIHLGVRTTALEARKAGILARFEGPGIEKEQLFDAVLVAAGRRPNSQDLGLENTDVQCDEQGFVQVDACGRTSDAHVLAIGDVAGQPLLAHKATRQGIVAVEALAGEAAAFDNLAIPAVVFTDPEIAWCGLTEPEARQRGRDVRVLRFPWTASGRARTLGRTEGLTKLLVDPDSGRLLGAGIVGVGAGELIAEATLAVETAALARDVAETIHAHPTLAESIGEAAETFYGAATHLAPRRKRS
jgi:dihydrolipoamide dehydrogenase